MLSILAFFAIRQSPTIDLTVPAASMPTIFERLTKATGMRFAAKGGIEREVLTLRLHNVPVQEALAKIADVVGGEWTDSAGTWLLGPSGAAERADEARRRAERRKVIVDKLDPLRKEMAKVPPLDNAYADRAIATVTKIANDPKAGWNSAPADIQALWSVSPIKRLLVRALDGGLLNVYSNQPTGMRVVYSSQPTPLQRPLPAAMQPLIRTFVSEQAIYNRIALTSVQQLKVGENITQEMLDEIESYIKEENRPIPDNAKLVVAMCTTEDDTPIQISLLDEKGEAITSETIGEPDYEEMRREGETDAKKVDKEPPAEISQEARAYLDVTGITEGKHDVAKRMQLFSAWKPRLLDPVQEEPLQYGFGPLLIRAAEMEGRNVVANLPDESIFSLRSTKPTSLTKLMEYPLTSCDLTRTEGWLTVRPKYATQTHKDRIRRSAARSFIQTAYRTNAITLDDIAPALADGEDPALWTYGHIGAHFAAFGGEATRPLSSSPGLRLYGNLSRAQRMALANGPIEVASIPGPLRDFVTRLVYTENVLSQRDPSFEPTEKLPNGVPPRTTMRLASSTEEAMATPLDESGMPTETALTPHTFGRRLVAGDKVGSRFLVSFERSYNFEVTFAPGIVMEFTLYDFRVPAQSPVSYAGLPESFRKEAEAVKAKATGGKG